MKIAQQSLLYLFFTIGLFIISGMISNLKAEAVFMNDGSIIEGKVIQDTDKYISFKPLTDPARVIQRKDIIRIIYSNDYKNKVYIYKMDNSLIEGYIVYEDKDNYTIRENLSARNELIVSKEKVNSISKKKIGTVEEVKKENLKNFSRVYIDIALLFSSPTLIPNGSERTVNINGTNYYLPYFKDQLFGLGGGLKVTITNSYSSFILFGGSLNFSYLYHGYSQFINTFNFASNLQALFGLNWNINNNVFIQPYIQAGVFVDYRLMLAGESSNDERGAYTVSNVYSPPENGVGVNVAATIGIKIPVRVGKDLFITPFVELSASIPNRLTVNAGLGISF
jgi:hypothetical protein